MDRDLDATLPEGVTTVADLVMGDPVTAPPVGPADDAPALRTVGTTPGRRYDGAGLRTDARKTANLLAHVGVREGRTLAVAADPTPEAVLGFLGAALVGARVQFVDGTPDELDVRGYLAPTARVGTPGLPPGGQRIGFGADPDDPGVTHFETVMWSENPTTPPPTVGPEDPLLVGPERTLDHETLLSAAASVREAQDLTDGDVVAVDAGFDHPGTVVAGVLAPLLSGATIVLVTGDDGREIEADLLVTTDAADAPGRLDPRSVLD